VRTAETKVVSAPEAKELFSGLQAFPSLVLAVSGGPDSTALMVLTARWRDSLKTKPNLIAVTVDHGLRKESRREAAAVARLARKLKIAHRTLRWNGRKPATGLQEAARAARYRLLGVAARKAGAAHILTAHTLDDQAETVLIRMARGSGLTGLGAMARMSPLPVAQRAPSPRPNSGLPEFGTIERSKSETSDFDWGEGWGKGARASRSDPPHPNALCAFDLSPPGRGEEAEIYVVRPLLDVPKSRLIATLRATKIDYADDPSNRDPRFTRVRLRDLMGALAHEGLDARRLTQLARRLKRADAAIESAVDRAIAELAVTAQDEGSVVIETRGFAELPSEVALRLLGRAIARMGDEGPVELGKLEALKSALDTAKITANGRFRRTLAGAVVTRNGQQLIVERAPPRGRKLLTKRGPDRLSHAKTR
jgi:tRNA(Ile)-lysidine synthase